MANDFQIVMLASSSKGNSTLISTSRQRFLVDVGISCLALTRRLHELGVSPEELDGVFLTHEHIDHVRGLATFMKKYDLPIYSSPATWRAILARYPAIDRSRCCLFSGSELYGDVLVQSFKIPHDAVDPHGYCFTSKSSGAKCTYLTDLGSITPTVREAVTGSDSLILEANHDQELLRHSPYPYQLQQRILSTRGHLANNTAGSFLAQLPRLPEHIVLAHLSEHNNRPQLARDTVLEQLDTRHRLSETSLVVAAPGELTFDRPLQTTLDFK